MVEDNNGSHKKKKWPLALILFLIVLVVVFLLMYRKAEAQEATSIIEEVVEVSVQNMRSVGLDVSAKVLGSFGEWPDAVDLMKSPDQPVFYFDGQELHFRTVAEIAAEADQPEEFLEQLQAQIENSIADLQSDNSWFVEYSVQGDAGYVLLSEDVNRSAGVLSDMSRIAFKSVYPYGHPDSTVDVKKSCTFKVLSTNIFGQTAESVQVCVEAMCQARAPESCTIYEKTKQAWLFGSVEFNPDELPENGNIYGAMCRGRGFYNWSVGFQGLDIFGYNASIPGLEYSQSGTITSETNCAP